MDTALMIGGALAVGAAAAGLRIGASALPLALRRIETFATTRARPKPSAKDVSPRAAKRYSPIRREASGRPR